MANTRNTKADFWCLVGDGPLLTSECWEWQGTLYSSGYGRFHYNNQDQRAHRLAYKFQGFKLRKERCLLHKCDNRKCCNPYHLFVGSKTDNMADKVAKGRQARGLDFKSTKLTPHKVLEIRKSKESPYLLASKYGVTWGHITKVRGKKVWKHV